MAGFFPLFFKQYWSQGTEATISTFWLGLGNSTASFIILLLAPLLGALADTGGIHKRLLAGFALLGIVCTAGFFLVSAGDWQWAIALYVVAIIGFSGANVFYDAMLPTLADASELHKLSALGYSLGYLGGGVLFAINVLMTLQPGLFGLADASQAVRFSFLSVAVWWLVFMLPVLLGVKEQQATGQGGFSVSQELRKLIGTLKEIRAQRNLWLFLVAYWLYIDGVATIIRMAVDYGVAIGLPANSRITPGPVHRLSGNTGIRSHRQSLRCQARSVDRLVGICHRNCLRCIYESERALLCTCSCPGACSGRCTVTKPFIVQPAYSTG